MVVSTTAWAPTGVAVAAGESGPGNGNNNGSNGRGTDIRDGDDIGLGRRGGPPAGPNSGQNQDNSNGDNGEGNDRDGRPHVGLDVENRERPERSGLGWVEQFSCNAT